jgi:hypothetical protein
MSNQPPENPPPRGWANPPPQVQHMEQQVRHGGTLLMDDRAVRLECIKYAIECEKHRVFSAEDPDSTLEDEAQDIYEWVTQTGER